MTHYAFALNKGADVVLAGAVALGRNHVASAPPYDGIRLWREFRGQPLQEVWQAPAVAIQKQACRAELLSFLRNAPAVTARGADMLEALAPGEFEFLELEHEGEGELFVMNATRILDELPSDDAISAFRLSGSELDCIYFSEAFKARAEKVTGLGMGLLPVSERYRRLPEQSLKLGSAKRMILRCRAPASLERVAQAEGRTGLRFPDSLRWLLTNCNGGSPSDEACSISQLTELRDGRGSAEWTYELLVVHYGLVPPTWFPFAHSAGGDNFYVDCASTNGAVYLVYHDCSDECIVPFTDTLADFVATISHVEEPTIN